MKQYTNEEIREFIKCPQFGDIKYGKWGSLRLDVRQTLLNLININDSMDYIIKQQQQELQRKDNIINELKEYLKLEIAEWQDVDNIPTKARVEEDKDILDKIIMFLKEYDNKTREQDIAIQKLEEAVFWLTYGME